MLTPFKLGVGGVIGSGRQYLSWIALDDLVRVIQFALQAAALSGRSTRWRRSRSLTANSPRRSAAYWAGRPSFRMPAFAARLAFGEMADEMLLSGVRALPHALRAGFAFQYPQLEPALRHMLERTSVRVDRHEQLPDCVHARIATDCPPALVVLPARAG